jgi:hypothetical protein
MENIMPSISAAVDLPVPVQDVWATYADFGNVQQWSPIVAKSYLTSQATEGIGVARHCDLLPRGAVNETISQWTPGVKMVVDVEPAGPIAAQQVTIDFSGGEHFASVRMSVALTMQPDAVDRGAAIADVFRDVIRRTLAGLSHHLTTGEPVDETTALSTDSIYD